MSIDFSEINYLSDPTFQVLHADYEQFLMSLSGPTIIDITGINENKTRVITTLLQGDEPSGLIAIHRWLTERDIKQKPETNLRFIICSVEAAAKRPLFSHKFLEGGRDINRCFNSNNTLEKPIAKVACCSHRALLIEQAIREVEPDVIIDLHNASSPSPAFSVSSMITTETLSLASFFCQSLILSDLKIGALMELSFPCPFITVECGYALDAQAHEIAFNGIVNIANSVNIGYTHQEKKVDVIYRPLRLRLKEDVKLSFAKYDEGNRGITLKNNIEYYNFGGIHQDEMIGWIDNKELKSLLLIDKEGENIVDEYFYVRDNQLVCKHNYKLFKATTNTKSAMNDCLFYVVKTMQAES